MTCMGRDTPAQPMQPDDVAGDAMMPATLASILINNYNYGRFLGQAIDSAVSQDYPERDSGGGSRTILAKSFSAYADRIIPIFKENGGPSVGVQRWRSRQPRRYFVLP
jgi:hypothetical protein